VDVPIEGASPVIVELPATRSGGGVGSLVDINTATQADLERLPEIGPALAQQILDYRQTHGPFPSIEAIQDVPGIGEGIYAKIKDLITVK
jgi:competence protein ComEA